VMDVEGGGGDGATGTGLDEKYGGLYEDKMDPFAEFGKRERERRYDSLTLAEKMTLGATEMFTSSKPMRTFVFFYCVFLHVFVFFTLNHYIHGKAHCH